MISWLWLCAVSCNAKKWVSHHVPDLELDLGVHFRRLLSACNDDHGVSDNDMTEQDVEDFCSITSELSRIPRVISRCRSVERSMSSYLRDEVQPSDWSAHPLEVDVSEHDSHLLLKTTVSRVRSSRVTHALRTAGTELVRAIYLCVVHAINLSKRRLRDVRFHDKSWNRELGDGSEGPRLFGWAVHSIAMRKNSTCKASDLLLHMVEQRSAVRTDVEKRIDRGGLLWPKSCMVPYARTAMTLFESGIGFKSLRSSACRDALKTKMLDEHGELFKLFLSGVRGCCDDASVPSLNISWAFKEITTKLYNVKFGDTLRERRRKIHELHFERGESRAETCVNRREGLKILTSAGRMSSS